MKIKIFDSEAFCGYKQITTFYQDFSIADIFGVRAILDTYDRAFDEWKSNYKYMTELVMVLNWKSWEHEDNEELCSLYSELYYKALDWAYDNLKGEELNYFMRTID